MSIKVQIGDVFSIPLTEEISGLGVVASKWKKELYLVLFDYTVNSGELPEALCALEPILAASSLDAKIWHGHWPIIGNCEDLAWISQPLYKVQQSTGWVVESFDRKFSEPIESAIADKLKFRKCVAPIRLELALKAHKGFGLWDPVYDELFYSKVLESNDVI